MSKFTCFVCSVNFDTIAELKRHISVLHETAHLAKFPCGQGHPGCLRTFSTLKSLYKHIGSSHNNLMHDVQIECDDIGNLDGSSQSESSHHVNASSEPNAVVPAQSSESEGLPSSLNEEIGFVLTLAAKNNVNRCTIDSMVNLTSNYLTKKGLSVPPFSDLETEHKRIKKLKENDLWLDPQDIVLAYEERINGDNIVVDCVRAKQFPLDKLLQTFLSVPSVFNAALNYMKKSKNPQIYSDCRDGTLCDDIGANTIPFVLFFDEIECNNPLGSHKGEHKLGVIYVSLRCFETYIYANLDSILPYIIIPSKGLKFMDKVVLKISQDISSIKDGICVDTQNLFIKFAGLCGDLGQHKFPGIAGSFSANYLCMARSL